ncbi:MAG: tRNA dihydrouridine synthase DusB [Proteobacteria bacterium]|nr:tRNA dihydrouridine synthase DusB [Pseudomonadota bacterium]
MRIGPHELPVAALLAPMAGVTDRPFRILARRFGAALAASEMITSDVRLWSSAKSRRRMDHAGEPSPRAVQLAGADPLALAEAARRNVDLGADIIDINMGCPAKKVCNVLCGSALLTDEPLVARILAAVASAVNVPVTLKTRTGWDRDHRNAVNIARIAEASGIAAIAVHGRTRADFYTGDAEYETIRSIKDSVRIPVIANGDIDTPAKARAVLDFTRADSVMIGRAAHGAPWIFRDVNGQITSSKKITPLSRSARRDIILEHLDSLYAFYGEDTGVRVARKHLGWYLTKLQHGTELRRELMAAENSSLQFALTRRGLDGWADGVDAA